MKKLDTIDHIAIQVNDIKTSLDWYLDTFKCDIIYCDDSWAFIEFKNIKLALVKSEQHPAHFAIVDDSINKNKNITTHRDGSKSMYITDKDSNYIELITYKNEY